MEALRMPAEHHSLLCFDSNDYRTLRIEELRLSAMTAAESVKKTRRPFHFNPMSSRERRIIHLSLRNETDIRSESTGTGPFRQVVVLPIDMPLPEPIRPPRPGPPPRGGPRDRDPRIVTDDPDLRGVAVAASAGRKINLRLQDTIVAISTPPGRSGVGVVRLSGSDARRIAESILRFRAGHEWKPWTRCARGIDRRFRRRGGSSGGGVFCGAAILHRRRPGRDLVPRIARGLAILPGARLRRRRQAGGTGRVHAAGLSERKNRSSAGRSGPRSD